METPKETPAIDDRRGTAEEPDSIDDRRMSPRINTLKGGQIVWPNGVPVKCIIRNLSRTGAKLEVSSPVPHTFELVFDDDQSRRSCRVVWQKETQMGVNFQ